MKKCESGQYNWRPSQQRQREEGECRGPNGQPAVVGPSILLPHFSY